MAGACAAHWAVRHTGQAWLGSLIAIAVALPAAIAIGLTVLLPDMFILNSFARQSPPLGALEYNAAEAFLQQIWPDVPNPYVRPGSPLTPEETMLMNFDKRLVLARSLHLHVHGQTQDSGERRRGTQGFAYPPIPEEILQQAQWMRMIQAYNYEVAPNMSGHRISRFLFTQVDKTQDSPWLPIVKSIAWASRKNDKYSLFSVTVMAL